MNYTQNKTKVKESLSESRWNPRFYVNKPFEKAKNPCTSLKFVTIPIEMRTAPMDLPSKQVRKSSWERRCSWLGLVKQTSNSTRETPIATSPAPGLQKQPVRNEIFTSLAWCSIKR